MFSKSYQHIKHSPKIASTSHPLLLLPPPPPPQPQPYPKFQTKGLDPIFRNSSIFNPDILSFEHLNHIASFLKNLVPQSPPQGILLLEQETSNLGIDLASKSNPISSTSQSTINSHTREEPEVENPPEPTIKPPRMGKKKKHG